MARRKRCVVKKRRKEEEKRRKREEKEEKNGDQIAKKKEKEEVRAHLFSLRSRHFLDQSEIRYLEKSTLYLLLFSCKIFSMNKLCDF